ncbi:MAG: hypothetical protein CSA50_00755 [Gammaproteobacteria bacterium]|nr:MAG: hypothetical protein CSA50_00755 [Gammaproteobacteria bacterium]
MSAADRSAISNSDDKDQRRSQRYLCSEGFSACTLTTGEKEFKLESINYSHDGIALFNTQFFPDLDEFTISFSYDTDNGIIRIEQLPCSFVHVRDTDLGVLLGAAFRLELATARQIDDLIRVEEHIAAKLSE